MNNLLCFKHPTYKGEKSPDLSCKTCCSLFVAKIRSEQAAKNDKLAGESPSTFSSLASGTGTSQKTPKSQTFDSSWI